MAGWATLSAQLRRDVHKTMAVPAEYVDKTLNAPVPVNLQWSDRISLSGALDPSYAQTIESIDSLTFLLEELATANGGAPLVLYAGGKVTLKAPGWPALRFTLAEQDPPDGPAYETWRVKRC